MYIYLQEENYLAQKNKKNISINLILLEERNYKVK